MRLQKYPSYFNTLLFGLLHASLLKEKEFLRLTISPLKDDGTLLILR